MKKHRKLFRKTKKLRRRKIYKKKKFRNLSLKKTIGRLLKVETKR